MQAPFEKMFWSFHQRKNSSRTFVGAAAVKHSAGKVPTRACASLVRYISFPVRCVTRAGALPGSRALGQHVHVHCAASKIGALLVAIKVEIRQGVGVVYKSARVRGHRIAIYELPVRGGNV